MYNTSTNYLEQFKNIAKEMVDSKNFVLEGLITSIDPNPPYKVKVMLQPYQIETGWLRMSSPYVGNGFGLISPPPEEGTAVKVIFHMGDISNGTVVSCLWNDEVSMPDVPYGSAGVYHKTGAKILINDDGSITISAVGGANLTLNKDGSLSLVGGNGGSLTIGTDETVSITGKTSSGSW